MSITAEISNAPNKEEIHIIQKSNEVAEDSLNDFPSSDEYLDKSKEEWQMPFYSNLSNEPELKNQMPPLIEEINFSKCKSNSNSRSLKRRSTRKGVQTVDHKNDLPSNKFVPGTPLKHSNSTFISNDNLKKKQIESNSNIRESIFLHEIDSEYDQYDSYYSYYDYDYNDNQNDAVIGLPPPLEIGMEMPSVVEPDIFDIFEFQLPYMQNPSDDDSRYIQEIDLHFDREKLLQEVKSQ